MVLVSTSSSTSIRFDLVLQDITRLSARNLRSSFRKTEVDYFQLTTQLTDYLQLTIRRQLTIKRLLPNYILSNIPNCLLQTTTHKKPTCRKKWLPKEVIGSHRPIHPCRKTVQSITDFYKKLQLLDFWSFITRLLLRAFYYFYRYAAATENCPIYYQQRHSSFTTSYVHPNML